MKKQKRKQRYTYIPVQPNQSLHFHLQAQAQTQTQTQTQYSFIKRMTNAQSTRIKALSLYRQLLRAAQKMPTQNRKNFVLTKTRTEYRENQFLTDPQQIDFHLRLADTHLDTVIVQAEHLTKLHNDPNYFNDI